MRMPDGRRLELPVEGWLALNYIGIKQHFSNSYTKQVLLWRQCSFSILKSPEETQNTWSISVFKILQMWDWTVSINIHFWFLKMQKFSTRQQKMAEPYSRLARVGHMLLTTIFFKSVRHKMANVVNITPTTLPSLIRFSWYPFKILTTGQHRPT